MAMPFHKIRRSFLQAFIQQMYLETGIEPPAIGHGSHIAPVGKLISSYSLVNKELSVLTPTTALEYLSQQGALIETTEKTSQEALAGFLYMSTSYGCLFVEASDSLARRRFSAAHELGHYLLHFRPQLMQAEQDQVYLELTEAYHGSKNDDPEASESGQVRATTLSTQPYHLPPEPQMEYEANQFAAELLMPEGTVRSIFARIMLRMNHTDLTAYMAREMLVSLEAIRWRLHDFGLLPLPSYKAQGGREQ